MASNWFVIALGIVASAVLIGIMSWTSGVCVLVIMAAVKYLIMPADGDVVLLLHEKFGRSASVLAGQVVWITGASSGSGAAIAKELAKNGAKLILSARTEEKLQQVKEECIALSCGGLRDNDVLVLPFNMLNYDTHEPSFTKVLEHFRKLDILICNAGRAQNARWDRIDVDVDKALFDLDVFSLVALSRIAVRHFLSVKKGHVVVMSSLAGKIPVPYASTYAAAKHALHGYFETLWFEKSKKGLHITLLCPGPFESSILDSCFGGKVDEKPVGQMIGPVMTGERCAELCVVAVANQLSEAWISCQPFLLIVCLFQYLPGLTKWACSFVDFSAISKKLHKEH